MGRGGAGVLRHMPNLRGFGRNRRVDYLAGLGFQIEGLIGTLFARP